ncbi:MAG: hypothetical protein JRI99_14035 [Deltaproteobacteria bacterium]|nr:hypothetical protein [Deltaproteobacteria bacterium]
MSVSLIANRLQSTIHAIRVTVSRPKRLQTVARFEKKYRMTPLVGLTISFLEVTNNENSAYKPLTKAISLTFYKYYPNPNNAETRNSKSE